MEPETGEKLKRYPRTDSIQSEISLKGEPMKNLLNTSAAFLLGAATGATLALLNAPQTGQKTRAQLRDGVANARTRAEEAIADAQARVMGKVEEAQTRAQDLVHEISDGAQHQVEKIKNLGHEVVEDQKARVGRNTDRTPKVATS
jgi:gas vesicle protein